MTLDDGSLVPNENILTTWSSEFSPEQREEETTMFQFTRTIMFPKGYDNTYENELLEWFNFLYMFEITLKLSFFYSKSMFQCIFAFLYASSEKPELRNCFSLLFNRIIIYLAGSSVSSTMLSKDALKNSNLVLSPLNFGSKNFFRFLFTRLNGNSFVFFGFGAFRLQNRFWTKQSRSADLSLYARTESL